MLSIDQWLRTTIPSFGVFVGILLTYRRFPKVCAPVDFLTIDDSLYDGHVSAPFLLVCDNVQSVIYAVGSRFYPAVGQFGAFSVGIYRSVFHKSVLNAISQ